MNRTSWVTWRLFIITIPVDIFAVVFLSSRTLISLENIYHLAFLALIAHLTTAPFFPLAIKTSKYFNNWKSDLLTLVCLGTIRGFALVIFGRELEIVDTVIDEFRIVNSAIAFPTWFVFFALATEARHQYQKEFNELFNQILERERSQTNYGRAEKGDLGSDALIERLQTATSLLGSEIQDAINQAAPKADYTFESQKIQKLIDTELRPTSKQLWRESSIGVPPIRKIDLIRIILLEQKLSVSLAIMFTGPLLFIGVIGGYGLKAAVIQTSTLILPVLISFVLIEKAHNKRWVSRRVSNLYILGLSWFIPIPLQFLVVSQDIRITKAILAFIVFQTALWVVLICVLIGFNLFYSINRQRQTVLKSLEALIQDENYLEFITGETESVRDIDLSRYLHGEIQTGLTAAVLLMQQASKSGDVALARQALENAVKILNQNHAEGYKRSLNSNELHLAQIVSGWRGIADVEISLEFFNKIAKGKIRDVVELIAEGVANAIRHGKATKVSVFDEEAQGLIRVHIRSNASDSPKGKSGLGTEMFNRLTLDWTFVNEEGQSQLSFTIPKTDSNN